jgi:hypothetical protein
MINAGGLVVMDKQTEGEKPWFCRCGPGLMATLMLPGLGESSVLCASCSLLSFLSTPA